MKDFCLNSVCVAAENDQLWRMVNDTGRKTLKAVSSAEQLQTKVSAIAEERDLLAEEFRARYGDSVRARLGRSSEESVHTCGGGEESIQDKVVGSADEAQD